MKKINMNNDFRYDIDMSQSDIEINGNIHHISEKACIDDLNSILNSKIELKNQEKFIKTGNLFIEYQIQINGKINPSGILTTESDWYISRIGNSLICHRIEFLKYCYEFREMLGLEIKDNAYEKNYIGYGLIIPMSRIHQLEQSYDDYYKDKRLKKVREKLYIAKDLKKLYDDYQSLDLI